jgi:hypothetical protein
MRPHNRRKGGRFVGSDDDPHFPDLEISGEPPTGSGETALPTVRIPVQCRDCGRDQLAEYPIPVVAIALTRWNNLLLHSCCGRDSWDASAEELQRIRAHLGAAWLDAFAMR